MVYLPTFLDEKHLNILNVGRYAIHGFNGYRLLGI